MKVSWKPDESELQKSNIFKMMQDRGFHSYQEFWTWSVREKSEFWQATVQELDIAFSQPYTKILDDSKGPERASWLKDGRLNIVDSCFKNQDQAVVVCYQNEAGHLIEVTQSELKILVNKIANGLLDSWLEKGDRIAIDMPMTLEAVAIYLGAIKAGMSVVTIADSFSPDEIAIRLNITKPKLLFTQEVLIRAGKTLPLYEKILKANPPPTVVVKILDQETDLRKEDLFFDQFVSSKNSFNSTQHDPDDAVTILFSSGTTGEPKAIPWTHTTPIKAASDGFYHHNIQEGDVVCWPTNLGWMMGPWLIFAALINKACIALFYGAPMGSEFGSFVQNAKVNMLGVVPSIVRQWKTSAVMEAFDWSNIKCFSSTGEASNPEEMEYLMELGNHKPVIEYCGGTEIGGGYVTSTVVQANIASAFSTQALGGEFVLLDDTGELSDQGEMFLIPPILGLSQSLLNRDHHEVYYKGVPSFKGQVLRKHGDELKRLSNGYYKAQGRADDAMNLGGIKVSSVQIEEVINQLDFVKESAAIAVSPQEGGPSKLVLYYVGNHSQLSEDKRLQEARNLIREKLNPLFKVTELIKIEKLPRTASGKVMRRSLRFKTRD